jgi:hypothetical protein
MQDIDTMIEVLKMKYEYIYQHLKMSIYSGPTYIGPICIYFIWIVLHYVSVQLYARHCAPLSVWGFFISPIMAVTPYCLGLEWLTHMGSGIMWILVGTTVGGYITTTLMMNNNKKEDEKKQVSSLVEKNVEKLEEIVGTLEDLVQESENEIISEKQEEDSHENPNENSNENKKEK